MVRQCTKNKDATRPAIPSDVGMLSVVTANNDFDGFIHDATNGAAQSRTTVGVIVAGYATLLTAVNFWAWGSLTPFVIASWKVFHTISNLPQIYHNMIGDSRNDGLFSEIEQVMPNNIGGAYHHQVRFPNAFHDTPLTKQGALSIEHAAISSHIQKMLQNTIYANP